MTTIIVHGTNRVDGWQKRDWWIAGPFVDAVRDTLSQNGQPDDLWRLNGRDTMDGLGPFSWSGATMNLDRTGGGEALADYLNRIKHYTDEPIRIIAYSQGCNVVKQASASPRLLPQVHIEKAIFLGCPHLVARSQSGDLYAYRLAAERFGKIANIAVEDDQTQTGKPNSILGPETCRWMAWVPPECETTDPDPAAQAAYLNLSLSVRDEIAPVARHALLHSQSVGRLCGRWLAGAEIAAQSVREIMLG